MIGDCRQNRAEGWRYLIERYVPVIRVLSAHYGVPAKLEDVLRNLHDPKLPLWAAPGPRTEREFVALLRLHLLTRFAPPVPPPDPELDLETMTTALEGFSAIERQFLWLESMGYSAEATVRMMTLEATSIQGARDRAAEALRGHMDRWVRDVLRVNGAHLGRLAQAVPTKDCLTPNNFIDMIDGRNTWARKKDYEYQVVQCWHCVDHFCRIREADLTLKLAKPLPPEEAEGFRKLLGVPAEKKGLLTRILGR
jgi:hypothetical protein